MKFKMLLMSMVLTGTVATASAQKIWSPIPDLGPTVSKSHPIALSVSYTAMIGNAPPGSCGCFLLNGGSGDGLIHVWRNVAAVVQITGSHADNVPQSQQGLSLLTYMGGPRYSLFAAHRLTIYGQFLVGGVHGFDSYFPIDNIRSSGAADSLAFAPGGGLEIGLTSWLSVRAIEAEFLDTHLPNNVNKQQNNLRVSSGVVFRFPSWRSNR